MDTVDLTCFLDMSTMASGPVTRGLLMELWELQSDMESYSLFLVDMDEEDILTWIVHTPTVILK